MKKIVLLIISLAFTAQLQAQDTFSIVAVDTVTGEVGGAGASCVDLFSFSGYPNDFLSELFPGKGAINTQAAYHATNQANARDRMDFGDTPSEIIDYLINNDVNNTPQTRQYGIVALVNGSPQSAAHTGTSCYNYKNHITGPNYSIQGNILSGQAVLDSMEAQFLRAPGDLACKLMAALQGANSIGADTRCSTNGTSSLFAFVKTSIPTDDFANPSFLLSVKTRANAGIEPIDSLQNMFTAARSCFPIKTKQIAATKKSSISIYPSPAQDILFLKNNTGKPVNYFIKNTLGKVIEKGTISTETEINTSNWEKGIFIIEVGNEVKKIVKL